MPVAHIGHCEILVPDLVASREFFTETIGLQVTQERDGQVFLRAWQDFDHHTTILTEHPEPGLGHAGWRVPTKEDALAVEAELGRRSVECSWVEGSDIVGHGDALAFRTPGGIPLELYWEVDKYQAPPELSSRFPNHPARIPRHGAGPRRFDHVTCFVPDPAAEQAFLSDVLGLHHRYYAQLPDGTRIGSWLSRTNVSHEIAVGRRWGEPEGMLHHFAYNLDSPADVLRVATMLVDHGYELEYGPGQHGTSGATFLYFKEPSGNRFELWTGGMLIFDPDWQALEWEGEIALQGLGDVWQSCVLPETFQQGTSLGRTATPAR